MDNTGYDGNVNTDAFQCAMLQYRNTPDQTTKLSPAMYLFGCLIRDFIPILPGKQSRRLPPLQVGECVRIQNQTGHYTQYDQYVIRVDGSGKVTLLNQKFMRKFYPVQPNMPLDRLIQAWQKPAAPDIQPPYESTSNDVPPVKEQSPDTTNSDE